MRTELLKWAMVSWAAYAGAAINRNLVDQEQELNTFLTSTTGFADEMGSFLEENDERLITALDGVSPAFIRELLRRAALLSAEGSGGRLHVTEDHLERALTELREGAGELTNTLLGARPPQANDPVEAAAHGRRRQP